jgi:putative SOS response-associated peptidase YedK
VWAVLIIDGKRIFVRFKVANAAPEMLSNLDVRPTQQVPALLTDHQLRLMKWGLVPSWAKDESIDTTMINARAEGIEEKSSFKRPLRVQRAIIPASAFFEWQGERGRKTKYRIARNDGDMFGMAGLYDVWTSPGGEALTTCIIITTTPLFMWRSTPRHRMLNTYLQ